MTAAVKRQAPSLTKFPKKIQSTCKWIWLIVVQLLTSQNASKIGPLREFVADAPVALDADFHYVEKPHGADDDDSQVPP
jgi:hypothetical protein